MFSAPRPKTPSPIPMGEGWGEGNFIICERAQAHESVCGRNSYLRVGAHTQCADDFAGRIDSTGQFDRATTLAVTLPSRICSKPVRPWVDMTIRSTFSF